MNDPLQQSPCNDAATAGLGHRCMARLSAGAMLWLASTAALVSLGQVRLINMTLDFGKPAEAMRGIYDGMPAWRVYQSRVLAPYLIEWSRALAGVKPALAYNFYAWAMLVLAGLLAYVLGARIAGRRGGALGFATLHLGFALLLHGDWLYGWDFINICVFLLFGYFVATQKPYPWFVVLFCAGLLNHEGVIFIALWLVIDPISRWMLTRRALEWKPIAAGIICGVCGIIVVETLRMALLVREMSSRLWYQTGSAHIAVLENIKALVNAFVHPTSTLSLTIPLFLLALIALAATLAIKRPRQLLGYSLVHIVMVAALLVFGLLLESRIYLSLLPFVVLAAVVLCAASNGRSFSTNPDEGRSGAKSVARPPTGADRPEARRARSPD